MQSFTWKRYDTKQAYQTKYALDKLKSFSFGDQHSKYKKPKPAQRSKHQDTLNQWIKHSKQHSIKNRLLNKTNSSFFKNVKSK